MLLCTQKKRFDLYQKNKFPFSIGIKIPEYRHPIENTSISQRFLISEYTHLHGNWRREKGTKFLFRVHETSLKTIYIFSFVFIAIWKILSRSFYRRGSWGLRKLSDFFQLMKWIKCWRRIRNQACTVPSYAALQEIFYLPCRWAAGWMSAAPSHAFPVAY